MRSNSGVVLAKCWGKGVVGHQTATAKCSWVREKLKPRSPLRPLISLNHVYLFIKKEFYTGTSANVYVYIEALNHLSTAEKYNIFIYSIRHNLDLKISKANMITDVPLLAGPSSGAKTFFLIQALIRPNPPYASGLQDSKNESYNPSVSN